MRSRPLGTDLSSDEAATVARFDAAPDADESLRMRVAAIVRTHWTGGDHPTQIADAAIAVMRGDDA